MVGDEDMTKSEQDPNKFNIGLSEEEINRRKGPVWQHTMPDIRMQDDQTQRQREEDEAYRRRQKEEGGERAAEYIREQDPYYGLNRNFQRMIRGLEKLDDTGVPDTEKEQIREKLSVLHERLMIHFLSQEQRELETEFLKLRNPVPFETRTGDYSYENILTAIKTASLEEEWAQNEEAQYWLIKTFQDMLWMAHNRELKKGMAGGLDKFFDWEKILLQVQERYRVDPLSESYEITFAERFRGDVLQDNIQGRTLNEREALSIRERGVLYHSDYRFWSMAVAGIHQAEYDENGKRRSMGSINDNGEWVEGLNDVEFEFTQLMFGVSETGKWVDYEDGKMASYKGREFPHSVLNWHSMRSSQANKEIYIATMSELLTRNIKKELENPDYKDVKKLKALVKDIKEKVKRRRETWYSLFSPSTLKQNEYLDQLLADNVVESGIVFDWGHKSSIHLFWGWDYDKEGNRDRTGGATIVNTDANTGPYWMEYHRVNTVNKGWPSGPLPEMSPEYAKMLGDKPPGYKSSLSDMSPNAGITDEERRNGKLNSIAFQELERDIKEVNPELWDLYFEKMIWYWETPYKDAHGKYLVLPMWVPPVFESVNFWKTIPWDPKDKIKLEVKEENGKKVLKGGLTVWDALEQGKVVLYEKEWSEDEESRLVDQAYYRHLVTLGQLQQILHAMTAKPELAQEELAVFFNASSMLNQWEKRDELGPRDERLPIAVMNMSLLPLFLTDVTARIKRSLFSVEGRSSESLGEWIAGDVEEWRRAISHTIPKEREGIKGYRDAMIAFLDFYVTQYTLAAHRTGELLLGEETNTERYLLDKIKRCTGIKVSYRTPSLEPEMPIGGRRR